MWLVATNHGPWSADGVSDLFIYSVYADLLRDGQLPYRDFGFEYPPLAAVPIGLSGGDSVNLSLGMLGCALVAQEAARALGGVRAAWLICLIPLLAGALVRTRFDLLPAALALVGLLLVLRRRPALAGAVLGLGALAKLWPALVALVAVVWLWDRRAVRLAAAATIVVAAGALPFLWIAPEGFVAQFEFHLDRPVQIESIPATALFVLGDSFVTGDPFRPDEFKSNGLDGGPAGTVAVLAALGQLAMLGVVLALVARRRGDPDVLLLGALGAALAFVALGKVLSPQFLLWLLPLGAVVAARGRPECAIPLAGAGVLTLVYFPGSYFDLVFEQDGFVALVAIRNLLLLLALAATARALARSPVRGRPRLG